MSLRAAKKFYGILIFVLCIVMLGLPCLAIEPGAKPPSIIAKPSDDDAVFRVLISKTGEVCEISRREYLFGTVASEMGADAPLEALKAQAVACYTYALYRQKENVGQAYDITDSPNTDQKFTSRAELMEKWGANGEKYANIITQAVEETLDYVITDESNEPILAAYHAVSSGKTESAEVVWGKNYPYLQAVESIGDLLSPDYLSVRNFTEAELAEKLSKYVKLTGEAAKWIGDAEYSASGTVISYKFGGTAVSGADIRDALGLRSAAFDVSYKDGEFTFNVKGYGHGVGMSQYGARYLASTGANFVEILSHYYTGCKMKKVAEGRHSVRKLSPLFI